jgi:hypothetical protein
LDERELKSYLESDAFGLCLAVALGAAVEAALRTFVVAIFGLAPNVLETPEAVHSTSLLLASAGARSMM